MRPLLTLLCLAAALAPVANAAPPPPADLTVEGGEETWRPARSFRVVWVNPASNGSPIAAVHYAVRNPGGSLAIGPTRLGWPATSVEGLEVPALPGVYTAEVWLEDAAGASGPPATTTLRFDDRRPGDVEPLLTAPWLGRTDFPLPVRLSHPAGPWPVSGIRGYALSIAAAPGHRPCRAADRCSEAETDLRGGVGDDTYVIADLPEGTSHLEAVAVSESGMTSAAAGAAVLRVDKTSPATSLSGAPAAWSNRPVTLTATATDGGSGMAPAVAAVPPYTAIAIDGGSAIAAPGAAVTATVIDEGIHRVAYYARDLAGNVDDGGSANGVPNPPARIALVRIDRTPPSVSFVNRQDPSDPEIVRVRVADPLSGPDSVEGWIGVRRRGSGDPFERLPRMHSSNGELRARWDSDAYADGEYEFRAVGYDMAGNGSATRSRANGTAMVLSNPLKAATAMRAGFGPDFSRQRTVTYGHGELLRGRLTSRGGQPLASAVVRIVERFAAEVSLPDRVWNLTTGPDGAFAIRLEPGPSREVTAVFAGTKTLGRAASPPLMLGVRSGVRLGVSSKVARVGGAPLIFRGRVIAAPGTIPLGGTALQLQFRLPRQPWTEFRSVQTDRRGRFRYAYRFSDDDSRGVSFLFRAYAPAQANWPYEPAGSRPVAVRGF